jgi:hypothetical protein
MGNLSNNKLAIRLAYDNLIIDPQKLSIVAKFKSDNLDCSKLNSIQNI